MARAKGTGKPCGASWISRDKVCRVGLPSSVNEALNRASHEVGIVELINAAKHVGGRGAFGKAVAIRQQLRQEMGGKGNLKKGEQGRELKRRLEAAGLLPQKRVEAERAPSVPTVLKKELNDLGNLDERSLRSLQKQYDQLDKEGKKLQEELERLQNQVNTGQVKKDLKRIIAQDPQVEPPKQPSKTTGKTKQARLGAEDFDRNFKIYERIRGDADMIDWADTIKNAKMIGEGSYGAVLRKGDMVVKRGEIAENEARFIKRIGEADLGPRLLVGEVDANWRTDYNVKLRGGRLAMTVVPGNPMGKVKADTQFAGKNAADIYWKAMADLHRLGIAHNDAHINNLLIDSNGKGRWVDMGLAQESPKAVLAEALGAIANIPNGVPRRGLVGPGAARDGSEPGNWQTIRWEATGIEARNKAYEDDTMPEFIKKYPVLGRIHENKNAVGAKLLEQGFTKNELAAMVGHGIRSSDASYNQGVWAKLTDKQAQELINMLYEGV